MSKPLVIFDLETTGVDTNKDRIVEFAAIKVDWETFDEIDKKRFLINPQMPIPAESSDIHGIYREDIIAAAVFADVAKELVEWMKGCDLAGYNIVRFDIPILLAEFARAKVKFDIPDDVSLVDGWQIYAHFLPHTLAGAHKFYCGSEFRGAHRAMNDVRATQAVLAEQLNKHFSNEGSAAHISQQTKPADSIDFQAKLIWKNDEVCLSFGKHMGQSLRAIPRPYINWMLKNNVVADPKGEYLLQQAVLGHFATKPKKKGEK